jgi:carboxyl-terminal processing protease
MLNFQQPFGKFDFDKFLLDMKLKTSVIFFSFLGVAGIAFLVSQFNPLRAPAPSPQKEAALMRAILQGVDRLHFQPKPIDDKFSQQVYGLYLKDIDGGKRFFIKADIAQLDDFQNQLDDEAKQGSFQFFDLSLSLMEKSMTKTQGWYREILAKPLDFSKNETLEADGEKLEWAKDDDELRARWEKQLKYDVLARITEELEKQDKADFKGEKKTFAQLEEEQRKKVLDSYDKSFKLIQKADRARRLEIYLNAIANVFDPHSGYFSPREKENFDIQMSGKLEGIGAQLQTDGDKTLVAEIVPGGPAWKQGILQPKDVIVRVAQGETDAAAVEIAGWNINDVVGKIRGAKGTKVTLTIQKPDGTEKVITITRDVVVLQETFAKSLILNTNAAKPEEKVGYIFLPSFYRDFTQQGLTSSAADVAKEVEKLKKENVKGIILDLRGNGGGSLNDVVQMSGLFIKEGPIVQVKSRDKKPDIMGDNDPRVQWNGPFIVMVNSFSASASEILAAAMQDYQRAVIVGTTGTYGKGTVQRFIDLDNATSDESVKPLGNMKVTIQKYYRITGKTTQLDGVTPDIVVPDFYNLLEIGEQENEYPLESTTIEPVAFGQNVYNIIDLSKLKSASEARVSADATFKKVNENATRLRKLQDRSQYPLQAEKYRQWHKRQEEEADQYDNLFKPIESFNLANLQADLAQIQADTSRTARNNTWLENKKKDIQLYEALHIMLDMIEQDALAGKF